MIIVRFIGGLGNQMFQYCFYKHLESLGHEVKADISDFEDYELHNGFELERVFEIVLDKATKSEIAKLKDSSMQIFSRIRRKLFGQKKSHIYQSQFSFDLLKNHTDLYLDGYWHEEKFIPSNLKDVQNAFNFKVIPSVLNKQILLDIRNTNSVSIHIRRGDYLNLQDVYAPCDKIYYADCISFFENNFKELNFYIFSNDIVWAKENLIFKNSKCHFIEHNSGLNSFEDLRLMSSCDHNIIANSSFSWWGAILNKNREKNILCPEQWYTDANRANDIFISPDWKKIPNN